MQCLMYAQGEHDLCFVRLEGGILYKPHIGVKLLETTRKLAIHLAKLFVPLVFEAICFVHVQV